MPEQTPPPVYAATAKCLADGCQMELCYPNWSDPYGCGTCCRCQNACYDAAMDELKRRNP